MGNYCCIAARGGTTDPDSTTPTRPKPARARQRPATPPSSRRMIALPAPSSQTTLLSSAPSLDGGHPLKSKAGFGPRREEPSPLAPWADQAPAKNDEDRSRPFTSTVQSVLSDDFRFRILVAGKPGSGKSSLINSIFKVPTSAASANVSGDIDARFCTRGNRYLVVHEYSGLESRDLETIQDFVRTRSDPNYSMPESLHAIWICISVLELVHGKLDEGVKDILCLGVPVVLVFTKLDELALSRVAFGDSEDLETARSTAHTMCERSFRSLFHENSGVVSAAIVSTVPGFGDLISKLVTTTDDVIIAQSRKLSRTQRAQPRMSPVLLAWSISQRASHDLIIRAAIEVGRSKCWRGLSSSDDFAGHTLESFLDVIHTDIVDVWNFPDKDKYLWCEVFKADIFRLVKDWSGSGSGSGLCTSPLSRPKQSGTLEPRVVVVAAPWLNDPSQNSNEHICCVMGYIVDLTVILSSLFKSTGDVSTGGVQSMINDFVNSGRRTFIHTEISSFVGVAAPFKYLDKDLVMEKIIDLIAQFCVPEPSIGYL